MSNLLRYTLMLLDRMHHSDVQVRAAEEENLRNEVGRGYFT